MLFDEFDMFPYILGFFYHSFLIFYQQSVANISRGIKCHFEGVWYVVGQWVLMFDILMTLTPSTDKAEGQKLKT